MPPKNSWVDDETECLLNIWEALHIQAQLDSPTKADSAVYNRITKEMSDKDFEKTTAQCKDRMKYLRKSYRQCRDQLKRSGRTRKLCKFYAKLNQILKTRPASSPGKVVQSLTETPEVADRDISDSDSLGVEPLIDDDDDIDLQIDDETGAPAFHAEDVMEEDKHEAEVRKEAVNDKKEEKKQQKHEKGKQRKSKVETSLELVMDKFTKSNEELKKMEREEKQRSADRDHQLRMMEMIINSRQPQQAHNVGHLRHQDTTFSSTVPEGRGIPADDTNLPNIYPPDSQRHSRGSVSRGQDGSTYYNM